MRVTTSRTGTAARQVAHQGRGRPSPRWRLSSSPRCRTWCPSRTSRAASHGRLREADGELRPADPLLYRNWQYHFEFLNLGYIAYLDFFGFCKEAFPGIPDQAIAKMVQGVDMELFRPDDELKNLAKSPSSSGCRRLREHRRTSMARSLRCRGRRRREWVAAYEAAQDPWFNFTVGNGFYGHDKYWLEHQEIPLGYIKDYIRRLEDGQQIMRPVAGLDRREGPDHRGVRRPARRRDPGAVRRQARARRHRLPVRGEPQLLHRALDHGRVLAQGARARRGLQPRVSGSSLTTCCT